MRPYDKRSLDYDVEMLRMNLPHKQRHYTKKTVRSYKKQMRQLFKRCEIFK